MSSPPYLKNVSARVSCGPDCTSQLFLFFIFWQVSIGVEIPNGLSSGGSFRDEWIASCCVRDDLQQVEGTFCPRNQVAGHCRIQGLVVPAPWYERHEYKGSDDVLEGK
jgi:hypothetical protein